MDVGFANSRLARMCNSTSLRVRKLGQERAEKLLMRLDQLAASDNLAEFHRLPQARCHQLVGGRDEQFSADLDGPYRLIFEVANIPIARLTDGGIDLSLVTRVRVLEIADPH
ncbi:type II toxin-antitoxin system RelE/ParE family toxin [Arthrobacter ruber]|uniref:type II toxin-antitoxin system RelE/ParE family toxin n=1 Tax=Arthrobacter ruber TaxID=1258893 RepID=UPI000CF56AA0|nr:type II toxin-antitoxin system RelE/ParE family toxin [Arthrobacter ruber]